MDFHQFANPVEIPLDMHEPLKKNVFDLFFGKIGLNKIGLDALFTYLGRYYERRLELRPWKPREIPEGACLLDFHCHTSLSDGEGTFESILARLSRSKALDGIAFTNHPWYHGPDGKERIRNDKVVKQSYDAFEIVEKMKKKGQLPGHFLTFPGSAEFAPKGTYEFPKKGVELIGIGLPKTFVEDNDGMQKLRNLFAEELTEKIQDAGGLAILPHPFYFEPGGLSRTLWKKVDAVEAINQTTQVFVEPIIREFAKKSKIDIPLVQNVFAVQTLFGYFGWRNRIELRKYPRPMVGSSDAHIEPFVGSACTMFDEPIDDLESLRYALKREKGKPIMNPRWEDHNDLDDIIDSVWHHWGREIIQGITNIHQKRRGLVPVLKILTGLLRIIRKRWD
ncbi:MAG: PHP-associated domain-containing protein [Candidatus Hodarchaeota archaeon]